MSIILALLAQAAVPSPPALPAAAPPAACDQPVYMVVEGRTLDRARMGEYARALAASEIYQRLGGYYVTVPRPVAVFEGEVPPDYVNLTVRFPCLANARAFWNSRVYQEIILPLRQNPPAGDYTVTVYAEAPLRADMQGKVEAGRFRAEFPAQLEPQVSGQGQ